VTAAPVTALCPGSFDPVTNGHVDVIARAAACFDRLVVATVVNPAKPGRLPVDQRLDLVRQACQEISEAGRAAVEFIAADGLLVDIAAGVGAAVVVKGLRSGADFEYERTFAAMNASMAGLETMFVCADPRYSFVSSSLVWEIAALGGDVAAYVPAAVADALRERFGGPDGRNQSAGATR
jgi:pantetheine-phosphate adenylyltransferase